MSQSWNHRACSLFSPGNMHLSLEAGILVVPVLQTQTGNAISQGHPWAPGGAWMDTLLQTLLLPGGPKGRWHTEAPDPARRSSVAGSLDPVCSSPAEA